MENFYFIGVEKSCRRQKQDVRNQCATSKNRGEDVCGHQKK